MPARPTSSRSSASRGWQTSPGWEHSRVVALLEADADAGELLATACAALELAAVPAWSVAGRGRTELGATDAVAVRSDPHLRPPVDRPLVA